ncbi:hypothetical protein [Jeotgalibaca porci]|uniref:hypothetical protein n=1 Tax=Jeotgalibaca porci TaxID=1868793 RepID=UPI0035A08B10
MKGIDLSDFEFKTSTFKTLPGFWSIIYFESCVKSLEDFESNLPNDSEYFSLIKSSPVNYHKFVGMIQNANEKEVEE